jgi:aldose sugar dehydrogenase
MRMIRLVLAAVAFLAGPAAAAAEGRHATSAGAVEVQRVISGLSVPWAIAFLPDGGYLVTERGGRMLHLRDGGYEVVEGVPAVWAQGQGGLLDVVAARDFASSREIFFTFAEPRGGNTAATALAVARLAEDGGRLENVRVIWRMGDPTSSGQHFGSRIVEASDGTLFVTTGDRGDRNAAQDLGSHKGKLIRVNRDGSCPPTTRSSGARARCRRSGRGGFATCRAQRSAPMARSGPRCTGRAAATRSTCMPRRA